MSYYTATRCISLSRRNIEKLQLANHIYIARYITAAATTDKQYEDPALANAKPFSEMPKLPMLPFIGSAWVYLPIIGRYRVDQFHKADQHKHEVYGDVVREKVGKLNIVSSILPETMETLFRHGGPTPVRSPLNTLTAYRKSRKQWYNTTGVILLQGEEWRDLRTKTQKYIMKPQEIMAYLHPMQEVARDLVSLIRSQKDANNEVPEFVDKLRRWSLESVAYVGLDTRLGSLNPNLPAGSDGFKLIDSVKTQLECMNKLDAFAGNFEFWRYWRTPTWKKFEKASDVFTEIAFKYINLSLANLKRRSPDDDTDLTLLQKMVLSKELGVQGVMVTVADLLFGGIDSAIFFNNGINYCFVYHFEENKDCIAISSESLAIKSLYETSYTIGFLLYNLAKNPDKQEKLFKEINELLPGRKDKITPEIFRKLHYLKACLKESIRMHPITRGNSRSFDHDVVIGGYRVPAGTIVFCVMHIIGRSEKHFKNADKYIPERWLVQEDKPENPFAYAPFGLGIRQCLGRRLAELEMICNTAELIRNFKVEYHYENLDMITQMVNIPDKPLKFSFLER